MKNMKRNFTNISVVLLITLASLWFASCENADDLLKKGDALWDAGDYEQAVVIYGKAIKKKPSAELYYDRGCSFFKLEKYKTALDDFNSALNLDKDYVKAYKWRGFTYKELEDYQNAVSDLKSYTIAVKDDYYAFTTLSSALYSNNEVDDGIKAAASAIALDQNIIDGYNLRGYGYMLNKNYKSANSDFSAALKIDPENTYAKDNLAETKRFMNPLANTTWLVDDAYGGIGLAIGVYAEMRIDFGDSTFRASVKQVSSGITTGTSAETGTYTVSGNKVRFNYNSGEREDGTVIGNSLTTGGYEFRRIQ